MNLFLPALLIWIAAAPWLLFPQVAPFLTILFLLLLSASRLLLARQWGRVIAATPLNAFVLVYLLLAGGAFLLAPFPAEALSKLTTLICGLSGYLLVLDWLCPPAGIAGRNEDRSGAFPAGLAYLAFFLALAGGMIALGALLVVEWPQRQLWDTSFLTDHIPHVTGAFSIHANEVAGTLLLLLPFGFFLARLPADAASAFSAPYRSRRLNGLGWLLLGLMLLVLLLMQSRVALLALAGIILFYFVWGRWRLRWLLAGGAAGVLLLLLAGVFLDVSSGQISTWVSTADALSKQGALAPQSWPMRQEVWSAAGQVLVDYPVFGVGLDSFVPVSRANYPFFAVPATLDFAHAHNLWLQAGADMGWPGIVATTLLLFLPLSGLWLAARQHRFGMSTAPVPFGAALAGYVLFNLLDTISPLQRPAVLLWLILAGSAVILRHSGVFDRRIRYAALAPLALLAVLLLTPLFGQNRANWQFDQARFTGSAAPEQADLAGRRQCIWLVHQQSWTAAEACFAGRPETILFLQNQGQRAAYAQNPEEALAWYNMALSLDPTAASIYFWRGQLYEKQEEIALARADYEQAVRYAEQQGFSHSWQAQFHFYLGRAYVREKSWALALHRFETAVELDETQPLYFEALGDVLLMMGDKSGAEDAYERAGKK